MFDEIKVDLINRFGRIIFIFAKVSFRRGRNHCWIYIVWI